MSSFCSSVECKSKIPAVTIAAAQTRADTGAGLCIASGNQACKPSCACSPSKPINRRIQTAFDYVTAVFRSDVDVEAQPEVGRNARLLRTCQMVIQRYRMHGCPQPSTSAWQQYQHDMQETAKVMGQHEQFGRDVKIWGKLVTETSAVGLDNLMSVLWQAR